MAVVSHRRGGVRTGGFCTGGAQTRPCPYRDYVGIRPPGGVLVRQHDDTVHVIGHDDECVQLRAARYRKAIAGLFPAKDIVVRAPAEIEEWRSVPNAFVTTALREGRVIYEA